ncbi:MAG: hypothetical protein ACOC95_08870 [Planctomycetota bacterium]
MLPSATPDIAGILEALMLLCFGASWPLSILKTLRARKVTGKSLPFLCLVFIGYLAGLGAKFAIAAARREPVAWVAVFYAANGAMVFIDILLYLRFRERQA